MKKRKPDGSSSPESRNMRALGWLGGPALFGFVSCQAPDSPAAPAGKPKDTLTVVREPPIVMTVDTVPPGKTVDTVPTPSPTVFFHAGQACDSLTGPRITCSSEGELLACEGGIMGKPSANLFGSPQSFHEYVCHPGSPTPIPIPVTMGFNGSDAADRALPRPRAFIRDRAVPRPALEGAPLA